MLDCVVAVDLLICDRRGCTEYTIALTIELCAINTGGLRRWRLCGTAGRMWTTSGLALQVPIKKTLHPWIAVNEVWLTDGRKSDVQLPWYNLEKLRDCVRARVCSYLSTSLVLSSTTAIPGAIQGQNSAFVRDIFLLSKRPP